jgi:hypothetical protein
MGALFAFAAKDQLKNSRNFLKEKSFQRTVKYLALVWLPCGVYLALFFSDWSWLYFLPPGMPARGALTILAMIGYLLLGILGYYLAFELIRREKLSLLFGLMALAGLEVVGFVVLCPARFFYVGSYDAYLQNQGTFLFCHIHLLIAGLAIVAYSVIAAVKVYRQNRLG